VRARAVIGIAGLGFALALACAGASAGCGNDSSPSDDAGADDASLLDGPPEAHANGVDSGPHDATAEGDGGATMKLDQTSLSFAALPCGGAPSTLPLHVTNAGRSALAISATAVGTGFSVDPAVLHVDPGATGVLNVSAVATASTATSGGLSGTLELFTNDATGTHVSVALSGTPTGATLAFQQGTASQFAFPTTEVQVAAAPLTRTLVNTGNAVGTFAIAPPSDARFAFMPPDGGTQSLTLAPGATWSLAADFTPTDTTQVTATSAVTTTSTTCGASLQSIAFSGQGTFGHVTGWPSTVDLGAAPCGGVAPPAQTFTLTNSGPVDAVITMVQITGSPGFATNAQVGRTIAANGGVHTVSISGPPVAAFSPVTPVTATLSLQTDADPSPHTITLTEEPSGAVLAFDTSATPEFGSFGPVILLSSATQAFHVTNTGNADANVVLSATAATAADSGAPEGGIASPFTLASTSLTVPGKGSQGDSLTFAPSSAAPVTGSIAMTATGAICGALPAPLALSGSGIGGLTTVTPSSLTFAATCGGSAPGAQSFVVRNDGNANLTWSMTAPAGPGAARYTLVATPAPGMLIPGASSMVTVTAAKIASPADNPLPSAYAAQVTVTTDVPLDGPHVVSLGETPLGDQLSFAPADPLRFGQVPIGTSLGETFAVVNDANPGSTPAAITFGVSGAGAGAYTVAPASVPSLLPGGHATGAETVTFAPGSAGSYAATVAIATTDALCTPLPAPLSLGGTGTQGKVALSAATMAFGTDPADPGGLVNCGATGLAHDLTVSNVGNQTFQITALVLHLGSSSPYALTGAGAQLPAPVPIGQSVTITVTPAAIPKTVANPNDPTPFTDVLTVTTDAAQDMPHDVNLVMKARGAVVASTPLSTAWSFGTVPSGSIGTFTSALRNTGNAGVTISLHGLTQPTIFGLLNNPTAGVANGVTSIVGQFAPPSANGTWSDQGTLTVEPVQAFCEPLPPQWTTPTINLSGSSNSGAPITVSGSLAFPATDCGSAPPAAQSVTLTNTSNVAYGYTSHFNAGTFYSAVNGSGTIASGGTATIVVTPATVTPGPGVQPGSSPYADELLVTVATTPPTSYTIPIAWALNGAVLTLPQGGGPNVDTQGSHFYIADTTSGFVLPMANGGSATASVDFGIQPLGAFVLSPAPPVQVLPGITASPVLASVSSDVACPAFTSGTATFVYSGPVCQPFPLASVVVRACAGTY
jgi:hypothetical protein